MGGVAPDLVVLHYTAMESCAAARARLCDPAAEVSAHYLIAADGGVEQLVDEDRRAWHAGAGAWGPVTDINSRSIGIELDNPGTAPFAEAQIAALERLLADILTRRVLAPERVIGHSDMAPTRKSDPGPQFPWTRLAAAGLSVWPGTFEPAPLAPGPEQIARLTAALTVFGYRGSQSMALFHAFRLRFRPDADVFDAADLAMAETLARRWPVKPD